ncbi:formimidoyltetrahydrofolate cyclodeaminase [Streptomyces tsukubensis]|uniref:Formimidoyltetrahydrofolate cyclodeaminase n=1 Tax=Streptomyces tsukubensis TaxID=83656 RepID=A0A1V4A933_9ACTN|nr:formimidoyltetrahydrofolate cyclodeaminase [Streptomyces tsukubensis]QFR97844.1 formimidoyltetrahydrofolate cyclodeaminase [Streptomyces tsukubensis]
MRSSTVDDYLHRLAGRVPAPGGGATAALHAAQAAALLGMVARYTTGTRYAEHAEAVERITVASDELRERSLQLAEDDAAAFTAVTDAYALPKSTQDEKAARSEAIATALAGAATPPARVIEAALETVELAMDLLPVCNRNVVSDVAAAAEAARAAATTSRVNVEINLPGVKDRALRAELTATAGRAGTVAGHADEITAAVREEIAS